MKNRNTIPELNQDYSMNERQAAAYLGLAVQTIRNYRHRCTGPDYFKLGSRIVYRRKDLDDYLERNRISSLK